MKVGGKVKAFKVFGEPAASAEPSEGPLDDPAFGQDDKSLGLIGALDDFNGRACQSFLQRAPWIAGQCVVIHHMKMAAATNIIPKRTRDANLLMIVFLSSLWA
jgi:hypothetical protein